MSAYYNEYDPFAAQWLRLLISKGCIAAGDVDERDIHSVHADDLIGYDQCHFFAGIGGWSLGLRMAGWPDDRRVWTGSCPCQPFSSAGHGGGFNDRRNLWPIWMRLIGECKPSVIFGEQVEAAIGHKWLDIVQHQLETEFYAVGKAVLGACSVGAPHVRKRLFWVAENTNSNRNGLEANSNEAGLRQSTDNKGGVGRLGEVGSENFWTSPRPIGARPMEMGNGLSSDMGRLCGYGNAIVPQVAAEFVRAYAECSTPA